MQVLSLSGLSELTGIGPKCSCDPSKRRAKGRKTLAGGAEGRKNATAVEAEAKLKLQNLAVYDGCGACEVRRETRRAKRLSRKLAKTMDARQRRRAAPSSSGISSLLNTLRRARPDLLGNASVAVGDFAGNVTGEGASSSVGRSEEGGGSGGGCAVGGGKCECPLLLFHVAGGEEDDKDCTTPLPTPKRVDFGGDDRGEGKANRDIEDGGGCTPPSADFSTSCRDLGTNRVDDAGPALEDGDALCSVPLLSVAKVDVDAFAGEPGEGDADEKTAAGAKNVTFEASRLSVPRHVHGEDVHDTRGTKPLSNGREQPVWRGLGLTSCMSLWTNPLEGWGLEEC